MASLVARNVAVLHNTQRASPPEKPDDWFEEYDAPATVQEVCTALEELGVVCHPVEADRRLPWRLDDRTYDIAFNMAEFAGRRSREAVPAAICELLNLPYTGSDPLTLGLALDKNLAKRVVSPDIPVAPGLLIAARCDERALSRLAYPVVVKPNDEGSSKGIRDAVSLVDDAGAAAAQARRLRELYGCPVLVETFLPGPEVTVGVAGNGSDRRVLGLMEIGPSASDRRFVYSVEAKRDWRRRVMYSVPPKLSRDVCAAIVEQAVRACELLGCRDLARVDFRLDAEGVPRFLECNPLPGLGPGSGDVVLLGADRMSHAALVQDVLRDAAARYGIALPRSADDAIAD